MARNKYPKDNKSSPFASALRKLMTERGTTQEDLAKVTGKTRQTVSQYTNGISEPGYDTLVKIADYFDVSIDYLLGRTEDPNRHPCAADELGLSQTNIDFLKDPSTAVGRPVTDPRLNKLVRSFINDILDICRRNRLDSDFQMMMHILKRSYGLCYMEDSTDLPSPDDVARYIEHRGLFVLPAIEGIDYYSNKIGSRISQSLSEKYLDSKVEAHKMYADMLSEKGRKGQ